MATAPTEMGKPLSRHGALVLVLAAAVGLLACVGAAYAAECLDQSLTLPQDVEAHLGIPVLMSLPRCPRDSISLN